MAAPLLNRVRLLLQEPWFVGVLSLIAVLYVARNIVLPLVKMQSGGAYVSSPARTADTQRGTAPAASTAVGGMMPALGSGDVGRDALPADLAQRREQWFAEYDGWQRDPFLAADDPRQPGYRPPPVVAAAAELRGVAGAPAPAAPLANADLGLRLTAVMVTPQGRLALINRQVVAEGDRVSGGGMRHGADAAGYQVEQIGERDVVLSGSAGRVRLLLTGE